MTGAQQPQQQQGKPVSERIQTSVRQVINAVSLYGLDREMAATFAAELSPAAKRWIVVEYVLTQAVEHERQRTLAAERAAEQERLEQVAQRNATPEAKAARARWAQEWDDRLVDHQTKMMQSITTALERYTAEKRMEWTEELLGSTFARRDGSRVTWGGASIADHEERVAIFTENAQHNLEGAARHAVALAALREAGAPNLNTLVRLAA